MQIIVSAKRAQALGEERMEVRHFSLWVGNLRVTLLPIADKTFKLRVISHDSVL